MTTSHTAGPWSRHNYGYLVGPDGETPIYLRSATNLLPGSKQLTAEAEANMTLCSAAPELLEALQLLLHEVDESAIAGATDYGWPVAVEKSRAAIAKARGET